MLDRINKAQNDINAACESLGRQINIMEVCGTHTVSIFRNGIRSILPKNLKLLSGPGCPVCVTDQGYIDVVLQLAEQSERLSVVPTGEEQNQRLVSHDMMQIVQQRVGPQQRINGSHPRGQEQIVVLQIAKLLEDLCKF